MKKNITISWILLGTLTFITAYIFIFPLIWGWSTSLKSEMEFLDIDNWSIIPNEITFEHFIYMLKKSSMLIWYKNSIIVSVGVTFLVIIISMPCGYALSQINFVGRRFIFVCVILSIMVPGTALVIALFIFITTIIF